MSPILAAFVFVFGTVIGSFLNAVLWRLRTGESFVSGRSYCTTCRHELTARDLVPLLSWLFLRGKCRHCRAGISPSYFVIESATGILFLAATARIIPEYGFADGTLLAKLLLHWYFIATMVIVFVFDLRYMLILRQVTLPAAALCFLGNLALGMPFLPLVLGALVGAGIFQAQYWLSKGKWIGGGDIHLGLLIGAMLGLPLTLVALFIAYVSGAAVGVVLLATRRSGWQSQIPFGTFLAAGAIASLLWGNDIATWYLGLL
jgi:leader peptidase (prepilin peptidase)/N-methyltransferase